MRKCSGKYNLKVACLNYRLAKILKLTSRLALSILSLVETNQNTFLKQLIRKTRCPHSYRAWHQVLVFAHLGVGLCFLLSASWRMLSWLGGGCYSDVCARLLIGLLCHLSEVASLVLVFRRENREERCRKRHLHVLKQNSHFSNGQGINKQQKQQQREQRQKINQVSAVI